MVRTSGVHGNEVAMNSLLLQRTDVHPTDGQHGRVKTRLRVGCVNTLVRSFTYVRTDAGNARLHVHALRICGTQPDMWRCMCGRMHRRVSQRFH